MYRCRRHPTRASRTRSHISTASARATTSFSAPMPALPGSSSISPHFSAPCDSPPHLLPISMAALSGSTQPDGTRLHVYAVGYASANTVSGVDYHLLDFATGPGTGSWNVTDRTTSLTHAVIRTLSAPVVVGGTLHLYATTLANNHLFDI